MNPERTEVECTCKVTGPDFDDTTTDPTCPYHGENGTMVMLVNLAAFRPEVPPQRITGGLITRKPCPHCGRDVNGF